MFSVQSLLRYCHEGFLFYLGLAIIYVYSTSFPPIIPFVIAYLIPPLVLWGLSMKLKSLPIIVLFLLAIGFAAIDWVLGYSPFLAIALAVVCLWRSFSYLFNYVDLTDGPNEMYLFLGGLLMALFLYIPLQDHSALIISVIQFAFLLAIMIFRRLAESAESLPAQWRMYARWGGGALAVILAVPVVLLFLFPVVKWVFFTGFGLFATGIGYVIAYPFYWLMKWLLGGQNVDFSKAFGHGSNFHKNHAKNMQHHSSSFPTEWIWILLVCVALLLIVLYVRKKIRMTQLNVSMDTQRTESTPASGIGKRRKRRVKPPKDTVRRLFFQLQKKLAATGMGRFESESVGDWFGRLDLGASQKDTVASEYRKVRYGEEALSAEEHSRYEHAVKALIEQAEDQKNQDPGTG